MLQWTYERFQNVVLVASFQVESVVLIDLASRLRKRPRVITLDTGRLPPETYEYIDRIRDRYDIDLRVQLPEAGEVSDMVNVHGLNLFRQSVELRHRCCDVRKVRPLTRALEGADAWITGLRRDQGATRATTPQVAEDGAHGGIAKVAPLAQWTRDDVWRYVADNHLEVHPLYAQGYTSIGCGPCTRAVAPGEDERAGRWWWELDAVKECGLHWAVPS